MAKTTKQKTAKKKHPGGRPTLYKPEHCETLIKYFSQEPWKTVDGKRQYQRMPSLNGFAKKISVCLTTIYNWRTKDHESFEPEFLNAWKKAEGLRKDWLIDVGLSGLAPASSFKFVAVNCTDMRDKQETEHTGEVGITGLLAHLDGQTRGLPNEE